MTMLRVFLLVMLLGGPWARGAAPTKEDYDAYAAALNAEVSQVLNANSKGQSPSFALKLWVDKKGRATKVEGEQPVPQEITDLLLRTKFPRPPRDMPMPVLFGVRARPDAADRAYMAAAEAKIVKALSETLPKMPKALAGMKLEINEQGRLVAVELLDQAGKPLPYRHLAVVLMRTKFDPPPPGLPMPFAVGSTEADSEAAREPQKGRGLRPRP